MKSREKSDKKSSLDKTLPKTKEEVSMQSVTKKNKLKLGKKR